MGAFYFPLFVVFIAVTITVAVSLSYWWEFPKWVVFSLAPFISYAGLFALFQIPELIDKIQKARALKTSGTLRGPFPRKAQPTGSGLTKLPEDLLCPSCGAKDIALILYGLPGITRELEKAIENRKITLGGCLIYDGAPQWVCNACDHKFGAFRLCEGEKNLE